MSAHASIPSPSVFGALKNVTQGLYNLTAKFASYQAATPTATTTIGGRLGANQNSNIAQLQRTAMNWTAEMVFKNNPIAAAYIWMRINYCSSQMNYVPATGDTGLDAELRAYLHGDDGYGGEFSTMGVDCSMQAAFSRSADIETPIRGDAGLIWYDDGSTLRVMEFSADQLGEIYNVTQPVTCSLTRGRNGALVQGSGSDLTYYCGRYFKGCDCVAYKIYERTNSWYTKPTIYPAYDVLYFRDPASFRGYRGVTKFAAAIRHMEKAEDLIQAGLDSANRQARVAMIIKNRMGAPTQSVYPGEVIDTANGVIEFRQSVPQGPTDNYYYDGDEANFTSPDSPGPELIAGIETSDERVAIALGVNYAFLVNPSKVGGAPNRQEVEKVTKEFSRITGGIHRPILKRISNTKIEEAVNKGIFPPLTTIKNGRWSLPISPTVDAGYSNDENITNLRSGLECPQDLVAEQNRDWAYICRQKAQAKKDAIIAADGVNKELEALGIDERMTSEDIIQLTDNPIQSAQANQLLNQDPTTITDQKGKQKPATAKMADHDVAGEPRDDSGEWTSGGGGGSKALAPTKRVGEGKDSKLVHPVSGADIPAHIQALKLPPAWTDVKINPDANGDLLAQGKDSKGRLQSVYSDSHNMRTAAAKFSRIRELIQKRHKIFAQNDDNLKSDDVNVRENAAVSSLIHSTGIRPGSDTDTGAKKKAYGATTLLGKHVTQDSNGDVILKFTGKKGVDLSIPVNDPQVAHMLLQRKGAAGNDGKLFNTDDAKLRDYTHTLDGGGFKTKDFRTLKGTTTAIDQIKMLPPPKNEKEYKEKVKKVATIVSQKLGNTPAIALQAYIDPTVFSGWQQWREAA